MPIVLAIFGTLGLAGAALVCIFAWRAYREQMRRTPQPRRRLANRVAAAVGAVLVASTALLIAAPWGERTFPVVMGGQAVVIGLGLALAVKAGRFDRR